MPFFDQTGTIRLRPLIAQEEGGWIIP